MFFFMFPKMADKIPIIKSKRLISQLKPPLLCFQKLIVGVCVLTASICSVLAATCPSSVPPSMEIIAEQCTLDLYSNDFKSKFIFSSTLCNFTGYGSTQTYGTVGGPVSNSLYYLYFIQ